jgi:hypothetical protein
MFSLFSLEHDRRGNFRFGWRNNPEVELHLRQQPVSHVKESTARERC